ncbi:MAG: CPBP family intramembrane glutamic endopeptidase [Caulobacterales bacterium]
MDSPEFAQPNISPAAPKGPWLFWGSMMWLGIAFIISLIAQIGAFLLMLLPQMSAHPGMQVDIKAAAADFGVVSILLLVSYPFALAALFIAARLRRWRWQDYFALGPISWKQFGYGFAALFATVLTTGLIGMATGHESEPQFMTDLFKTLREGGNVLLLFVVIALVAPLAEELIFRGFLFRGLAASRVGVMGAIVISSALWAVIHTQYDAFYMGVIFIIGLTFGGLRAWSGTTTLTILLHALMNAVSFGQAWLPQSS